VRVANPRESEHHEIPCRKAVKMLRKAIALSTASLATAVVGVLAFGYPADAHDPKFRAQLRDPHGRVVGSVEFRIRPDSMVVSARLRPNSLVERGQFHGFHVHANDNPANGRGCVADASAARATWFVSADGHLSAGDERHGHHAGDLPSPLVLENGTARLKFTTDRIDPSILRGRAVVLHHKPDNFGNVPQNGGPADYTRNSDAATELTDRTGNAGDRVACGVVRRSR